MTDAWDVHQRMAAEAEAALTTAWPDERVKRLGSSRYVVTHEAEVGLTFARGSGSWTARIYRHHLRGGVHRWPIEPNCTARGVLAASMVEAMADKSLPDAAAEALRAGYQRLVADETIKDAGVAGEGTDP